MGGTEACVTGGISYGLKQIEYIVKIDDEHSITRAAEKLFVTQSALNQQLLRLEKELGAPLFHRSKVDMRPTEIGSGLFRQREGNPAD